MASASAFGPPRGMRDFYPEDMVVRNLIFDAWRQASICSGFEEYDACVVEHLELLTRKAGEEITGQIYHFKDKSGRDLALRPEMTPTLARMIAARRGQLSLPLKWFTIAQCFRYERTTRGRKREHYQWNLDILGESSVSAEAELIATATHALAGMGIAPERYRIHFSSRKLLAELLARLGIPPAHHAATFLALDKRGKLPDNEIEALLADEGVSAGLIPSVFKLLDLHSLDETAALLKSGSESLEEISRFLEALDAYGISGSAMFDIGVIRGLSYYTGVVFEAFDAERRLRAIFGGGRYERLLGSMGGGDLSGAGLGFGDVVIAELLAEQGGCGNRNIPVVDYRIGFMQDGQHRTAIRIAAALRRRGHGVSLDLSPEKPRSFFGKAGDSGARHAIFIGPDDVSSGTVRIKDLADRSEEDVAIETFVSDA